MTQTQKNALNRFDIPVADLDRATAFYSEILGASLERYTGAGIEGALFPWGGTVCGTLIREKDFTTQLLGFGRLPERRQ